MPSTEERKHELRRVKCCCVTLEDLFVILCLVVTLIGLAMTTLQAFDTFETNLWHRVYVASCIGIASLFCFLEALPSWRVQSFSPHIIGLLAIFCFGNAAGFGECHAWQEGFSGFHLEAYFSSLEATKWKLSGFPAYIDGVIFFAIFGLLLLILFAVHEFGLKADKYPRKRICKYILFVILTGISASWCFAAAVLIVNPDLPSVTKLFGGKVELGEYQTQPRATMGALSYGGGVSVGLLLFHRWRLTIFAKLLVVLLGLGHILMSVIATIHFDLGHQWTMFPNRFIGTIFGISAALILLSNVFAKCLAPKKDKKGNDPSEVNPAHTIDLPTPMNQIHVYPAGAIAPPVGYVV